MGLFGASTTLTHVLNIYFFLPFYVDVGIFPLRYREKPFARFYSLPIFAEDKRNKV